MPPKYFNEFTRKRIAPVLPKPTQGWTWAL